jgi:hypothetical protein
MSTVYFASNRFDKYDVSVTLPARFGRLLDTMGLDKVVSGKTTAIKMHVGRHLGYTTVHPLFVKILVDKLKEYGAENVFVTDQSVGGNESRGYTESYLGVPVLDVCGHLGTYFYPTEVDFKGFKNVDIAGYIQDCEAMINLSHIKGHGDCGYGGACKNIAMGCVTNRTRQQIHRLSGGIKWDESKCNRCDLCVSSCNHRALKFDKEGKFSVFMHHCTLCHHCHKVCPTGAVELDGERSFEDFQVGMAICTERVLSAFEPGRVSYINFLTNITAICDCWGLSTPPIVPDIGIQASHDIVAIEKASVDAIRVEDFLPSGAPIGVEMGTHGHLLERLHGKDPYVQIRELEKVGLGTQNYSILEVE